MFATMEEAEKAARMLRRVIGRNAEAGGPFDGGPSAYYVRLDGDGRKTRLLFSWGSVADLIESSRIVITFDQERGR